MDPLFATLITALLTAISVMWKRLLSGFQELTRRADDCEQDRERIKDEVSSIKEDMAVFKACPSTPCPAAEALRRRETFQLKPEKS